MAHENLTGWAETTVYAKGDGPKVIFALEAPKRSPEDGDTCPVCKEPLGEGERVFRVTEDAFGDEWVHGSHVEGQPDA